MSTSLLSTPWTSFKQKILISAYHQNWGNISWKLFSSHFLYPIFCLVSYFCFLYFASFQIWVILPHFYFPFFRSHFAFFQIWVSKQGRCLSALLSPYRIHYCSSCNRKKRFHSSLFFVSSNLSSKHPKSRCYCWKQLFFVEIFCKI